MQQLLSCLLLFFSLSSWAQPGYLELKRQLETEQEQFRLNLQELKISRSPNQIFQLDQYNGSKNAMETMIEVFERNSALLDRYPSLYPNNQKKMDEVLEMLIYYVQAAEFLGQVLPHRALATVLSELSSQRENSFLLRLINRTQFHLRPHGNNSGQRLHKAILRAQSWPIRSHPDWLRQYIRRAQYFSSNSSLLDDRYFVDRPFLDFFYDLKAGLLYQTGLAALPKDFYITHEQINEIQDSLHPGDIAVIKHYYKLTNVAFNGEWSHGLIYLGSWNKFKRYFDKDRNTREFFQNLCRRQNLSCNNFSSFLEHKLPEVIDYYKNDKTEYFGQRLPRVVLESIGEGVVISNIYEALRKDQLALIRPKMSIQAKALAVYTALQYMFRPYDYSFNFQSHHRLVCTEIIYNAYSPGVHSTIPSFAWERSRRLGRVVVQATDIVRTFSRDFQQGGRLFDFLYFLSGDSREKKATFSSPEKLQETVTP